MAEINFPNNPLLNEEHTQGSITWVWDGIKWDLKSLLNEDFATRGSNTFNGNQTINGYITHFDGILPEHSATLGQLNVFSDRLEIVEDKIDFIENTVNTRTFGIDIDGSGNQITTGLKGYSTIPYNCEILSWFIIGDTAGSIEIDIWKSNTIPTGSDSICGGNRPKLINQQFDSDNNLIDWNLQINEGQLIAFNVVSSTLITKINLVIKTKII